jgi:hypothetical protein
MLIDAGRFPVDGVIVSHCVPSGAIEVVNAAVLVAEDLTLTVCAVGSVLPICQTNVKEAGVEVSVAAVCPAAIHDARKKEIERALTILSSTNRRNLHSKENPS